MQVQKLGILHPGNMGISIAASAQTSGCEVYWASESRSDQTRQRAEKFSLIDAHTLENLCQTCCVIASVCPPHAAEEVAEQVLAQRYAGLYVDANAISPQRARQIGHGMPAACATSCTMACSSGACWGVTGCARFIASTSLWL